MALLPLRSDRHRGWQGLLALSWPTPHDFSAAERTVYELLMSVLGRDVGGLRTASELTATQAESALMYESIMQLNTAADLDAALRALLMPAPARDEAEVALCSIETTPDGVPDWLTITHLAALPKQSGCPAAHRGRCPRSAGRRQRARFTPRPGIAPR